MTTTDAVPPSPTPTEPASAGVEGSPRPAGVRFAGLDGLRAIAALGVLVTHVGIMSGYVPMSTFASRGPGAEYIARAEVGVALFFALSGFLLYRPFVSARLDGRPTRSTLRYFRHRFLRIFPAYWAALTVLGVVLDTRDRADFDSVGDTILYYSLLQSWSEKTALGGLQQAWTLHNEIMFYVLLPLWAAAAAWLASRLAPRRALALELGVLAALAVGALAWRQWLHSVQGSYSVEDFDPRFHWLLGQFHLFVPGMALAVGFEWARRRDQPVALLEFLRRHPLASWGVAAAAFWMVSVGRLAGFDVGIGTQLGSESGADDLVQQLTYAAVGFFLLAPVALATSSLPRSLRWLANPVPATLGLLSYGIYLWHIGVIDLYFKAFDIEKGFGFADTPFFPMLGAVLVGSVTIAAVSYVVVEKPALSRKDPKAPA
jgi:peptidoglycan/LPS O-acetylase OafA/YrhL